MRVCWHNDEKCHTQLEALNVKYKSCVYFTFVSHLSSCIKKKNLECLIVSDVVCLPPGPDLQNKMVTNEQMDEVAAKLGGQWKTLAEHLEVKAVDLREIEADNEDAEMQAKMLLVAWQDRVGSQATVENLVTALNTAGFSKIAEILNET